MARAVVVGLVAVALACAAVVLVHAGEEIYAVPGWAVVVTVVLSVLAVAGAALILRSRAARFGAILTAAIAFGVFGILAILSVGVLALGAAAALLAWAMRAPEQARAAAAGAVLVGVSLPVVAIFALAGPVVDCREDGSRAGENIFLGLESSEGSGGVSASLDGRESGHASGETYEYTYTCERGRLVEFDLRRR